MPSCRVHRRSFAGSFGVVLMLLLVSAGPSFAAADVRFVHAVPGAAAAEVKVTVEGKSSTIPATGFGNSSSRLEVGSGSVTFTLIGGGETLASLTDDVADDQRYTLVALAKPDGEGASLALFEDARPKAGKA